MLIIFPLKTSQSTLNWPKNDQSSLKSHLDTNQIKGITLTMLIRTILRGFQGISRIHFICKDLDGFLTASMFIKVMPCYGKRRRGRRVEKASKLQTYFMYAPPPHHNVLKPDDNKNISQLRGKVFEIKRYNLQVVESCK